MKKLILLIYLLIAASAVAQTSHSKFKFDCALCHSCENPTKTNPCLKPCPRESIITVHHSAKDAPDEIIMDNFKGIEENYEPVRFAHRAHAEMSVMSGGCEMCHHYNPPGRVASCKDCHEVNRLREDLRKPDLKAAYHRECIECHKIWNPDVSCVDCHAEKGRGDEKTMVAKESKREYHPKIETPDRLVFDTREEMEGYVTFYHNEHINLFGLECTDCHQEESCAKCHSKMDKAAKAELSVEQKHAVCSRCHDTEDNCESCHKPEVTKGFNHQRVTGFDLSKNHSNLKCISCHKTPKKFSGLKGNCNNCHKSWTVDNFDHALTGLKLSETHAEFECENCHVDGAYQSPTCDNCHDDMKYPDDLPGERIK